MIDIFILSYYIYLWRAGRTSGKSRTPHTNVLLILYT